MVSLLSRPVPGHLIETATIGFEGVIGASESIQNQASLGLYLVQLPGKALRIENHVFRSHLAGLPALKTVTLSTPIAKK